MIHAGGGSGCGHSTAGGGAAGRVDAQPLAPRINISPQAIIFDLRTAQPSIRGPLGLRISFIDFPHSDVAPPQDLARLALRLRHAV
ncbi:hypothetical protein D9M68_676730 [compost metagenome]